jgi:hypothetical protein
VVRRLEGVGCQRHGRRTLVWGLVHGVSVHFLLAVVVSTKVLTALVKAYLRSAQVCPVSKKTQRKGKRDLLVSTRDHLADTSG